jgi:hypothetical protein
MKPINLYGDMHGKEYDWVFPERENRTPEQCPYGFDPYFLWKDRGFEEATAAHSDRMRDADKDKFSEAFVGLKNLKKVTRKQAQSVVETFFGENFKCVGYAVDCNEASGNPIGVFYYLEREHG